MYKHSGQWATLILTDQVSGQVNKVGIVLVDELNHGSFQKLIVKLQVLSHLLKLDLLPTLGHKQVNVKVILQTDNRQQDPTNTS